MSSERLHNQEFPDNDGTDFFSEGWKYATGLENPEEAVHNFNNEIRYHESSDDDIDENSIPGLVTIDLSAIIKSSNTPSSAPIDARFFIGSYGKHRELEPDQNHLSRYWSIPVRDTSNNVKEVYRTDSVWLDSYCGDKQGFDCFLCIIAYFDGLQGWRVRQRTLQSFTKHLYFRHNIVNYITIEREPQA